MVKKKEESNLFESSISFEEALQRLELNVEKLEEGNISLKDAIAVFKESMKLSDLCLKELNEAEQILSQISVDENGTIKEINWDPAGGGK